MASFVNRGADGLCPLECELLSIGINQRCNGDEAVLAADSHAINASLFPPGLAKEEVGTMRANDGTLEAIILNQAITYATLVKIKPASCSFTTNLAGSASPMVSASPELAEDFKNLYGHLMPHRTITSQDSFQITKGPSSVTGQPSTKLHTASGKDQPCLWPHVKLTRNFTAKCLSNLSIEIQSCLGSVLTIPCTAMSGLNRL